VFGYDPLTVVPATAAAAVASGGGGGGGGGGGDSSDQQPVGLSDLLDVELVYWEFLNCLGALAQQLEPEWRRAKGGQQQQHQEEEEEVEGKQEVVEGAGEGGVADGEDTEEGRGAELTPERFGAWLDAVLATLEGATTA
jgi:hypothetical protein